MNAVMIATLVIFGGRMSDFPLVVAAAWGTVIGAAAQFGVQVPFVFRYAKQLQFALDLAFEPVRRGGRNFTPGLIGRGAGQLTPHLDNRSEEHTSELQSQA